jgi:ribosome-associated heat shock protein Hsp15
MDGVRLDKWLQVARVFKSRTQATHACDLGRVKVNGQAAKPHRSLALGDRVEVDKGEWERLLVVCELHDKPLPKAEAARLYEDLTPPRPVLGELEKLLRRPPEIRDRGTGRPTKRDRRLIEKLRSE